jgi:hypothetical protein
VAPTSLVATATNLTTIALSWVDTNSGAAQYIVQRSPDGTTGWTTITTTALGATSYNSTGLASGTTYYYRLSATNGNGNSAVTATVHATTGSIPSSPSGLSATVASSTSINLSWTDNDAAPSVATSYTIQRATDNAFTQNVTNISVGAASVSYSDTGLTSSTTYYYHVAAVDAAGTSAYSNTSSATTTPGSTPSAPTSPFAVNIDSTMNAVFWSGVSLTETSITIQRKTGVGGTYADLVTLGAGENEYLDISCFPATTYYYHVRATNGFGDSLYSSEVNATTAAAVAGGLADPSGLILTAATATTVSLSFTDNATGQSNRTYQVERSDNGGMLYRTVACLGTNNILTDVGLTPSTTYWYRVRGFSTAVAQSNYTSAGSVTTPARTAGLPIEPSTLLAVPAGPTSVNLTWTQNDGNNPQYEVWKATWNASLSNPYSLVTTTTTGATSYTVTGLTAETPYLFKVRANNGTGTSDYAIPKNEEQQRMHGAACATSTSSATTGGTTYNIGPGQTYTTPGAFDWSLPGPGDTINIYPTMSGSNVVPYTDLILFGQRGTPSARIVVQGQPDSGTGLYPIFDAANGVACATYNARSVIWGLGAFHIGRRGGATFGFSPGYITLQNLEFRNAYTGNTFTTAGSVTHSWGQNAAGMYMEMFEDLIVQGCTFDANGNGAFAASHATYDRPCFDLSWKTNYVWGNSGTQVSGTPSHNTYFETVRVTYEANHYGPIRTGGQGIGLKDRSTACTVRYNFIESGNHEMEFAEAQNHQDLALSMTNNTQSCYANVRVYGNVLFGGPGFPSSPMWYGGDQGNVQFERKGLLYSYHNTFLMRHNQSESNAFKVPCFLVGTSSGNLVDSRNDIICVYPDTQGATPSDLGLLNTSASGALGATGNAHFGAAWASHGYHLTSANGYVFNGHIQDSSNVINGVGTDPGFVNQYGGDFHLTVSSVCVGVGTALPGNITTNFPVNKQYHANQSTVARSTSGAGADLGAYQQGVT